MTFKTHINDDVICQRGQTLSVLQILKGILHLKSSLGINVLFPNFFLIGRCDQLDFMLFTMDYFGEF